MRVYDERTAGLNLHRAAHPRPRSHLKALLVTLITTGIVVAIPLTFIFAGWR